MSLKHLVRTNREIDSIRESGRMLGQVLSILKRAVEPGVTTNDINEIAKKEIKALGGKPAFYGYQGFPANLCASVNSEVVHGIPSARELRTGDIASFDCGVNYKGMITDAAFSVIVGTDSSADKKRLLEATKVSLDAGIEAVADGVEIRSVSQAIESVLTHAKLGIVKDLVGHGVGRQLHEAPEIPNYESRGSRQELLAGMTIAIEPMATLGTDRIVMGSDGWTISTQDNSLSAHFEHTVLVTEDGAETLTVFEA